MEAGTMKPKLAPALKFQCYFLEKNSGGGWTHFKTEKARRKMFYGLCTMRNDVRAIDFIGTRYYNCN